MLCIPVSVVLGLVKLTSLVVNVVENPWSQVLGTKVRGAVVFAFFSLYLVSSHSQLGLFLAEPPFVSAFVFPLS